MSNHKNHRRGEDRRSETGPRYESHDPGKGCNSTHVARSRSKWNRRFHRAQRRTQGESTGGSFRVGQKIEDISLLTQEEVD